MKRNQWQAIATGIAFVAIMATVLGVWIDTQRDIAKLQVEVVRNKENISIVKQDVVKRLDRVESKIDRLIERQP